MTQCFDCGQYGHYRSDCPHRGKTGTTRPGARPAVLECRLCGDNHFMRDCPQLEIAKRLLRQEASTKTDSKPTSTRTSAPTDSTTAFKKDGTAVVFETNDSPVRVCDPALPVCEGSSPGTPRMALFFVLGSSSDSTDMDSGRFWLCEKPHR